MQQSRRLFAVITVLALLLQLIPGLPRAVAASPQEPTLQAQSAMPKLTDLPSKDRWEEDEDKRTANTRHYRAGKYMVAEVHALPIHTQDSTGRWKAPTALVASAEGGYATNMGHFKAAFTNKANGNRLDLDLSNGKSIALGLDEEVEPGKGPAGFSVSIGKNKVKYRDVGGHIDYDYMVDPAGVKETITLKKPLGKNEFLFRLSLRGLEVKEEGQGAFSLWDPAGSEPAAIIPPAFAFDAAGEAAPEVAQVIVQTPSGPALMVSVSQEWLEAPERKYPVVIDPSVLISPAGTDRMMATIYRDGFRLPDTMNVFYEWSANSEQRALVKFDLSSVPQGP